MDVHAVCIRSALERDGWRQEVMHDEFKEEQPLAALARDRRSSRGPVTPFREGANRGSSRSAAAHSSSSHIHQIRSFFQVLHCCCMDALRVTKVRCQCDLHGFRYS